MSGSLCTDSRWELAVDDVARAKRFYARVFEWSFEDADGATRVTTPAGLDGDIVQSAGAHARRALNAFFPVADVAATLRAAVDAGARVLVACTKIEGLGAFAMFLDPDRIPIAVFARDEIEAS
jgi:predicted enzyme related to lactoylglutathione lyase